VGVEPDQIEVASSCAPEAKPEVKPRLPKIRGNDYCPCCSGKKYN
jgi:hypothetical protein